MNGDTARLVERPYADLVDDLLTAIVGGVVNERMEFDVKVLSYPLAEPSVGVRGITGTAGGQLRTFLLDIDFVFGVATNTVTWLEDGTLPDDRTPFFVDYFRSDSRSPLSDINVGSVTRTLSEAVGREIATVYEQINLAYLSAFVDTATGKSLDYVVAIILDTPRKTAEYAEGLVTFFRSPDAEGNITIPAGLRLATLKGDAVFVTTQLRTLRRGLQRIDVPVRADAGFAGDSGLVDAAAITEMSQPVEGIERITNFDPMVRAAEGETDEELRSRAKAALRSIGKATLPALDRVIREGRGRPVEFFDPNGPLSSRSPLGSVTVVVEAEPERLPSLQAAVHETRAAGVLATLVARYIFVTPRVVVTLADAGISNAGKEQIKRDVVAAFQTYVDGLSSGDVAEGTAMLAAVRGVEDVADATIKDVVVARADLSAPDDADLVDLLATAAEQVAPGDPAALRAALTAVLGGAAVQAPTGGRVPDRRLLLSTVEDRLGEPATDDDIEAGQFEVAATVSGEPWWIALDMSPDDIEAAESDAED